MGGVAVERDHRCGSSGAFHDELIHISTIVLNREVEIRASVGPGSGQRTDIHVTATLRPTQDAFGTARVIIEVKGCWLREIQSSMETQLRDKYLRENECQHGLYLCVWFDRARWSDADPRRASCRASSMNDLRAELDAQAADLTTPVAQLQAFVLDASLL